MTCIIFYRDQLISGISEDGIGKEYLEYVLFTDRIFLLLKILACRLNDHLEDIERNHSIHCRWNRNDNHYQECLQYLTCKKREVVLISLMKIRQKREFFSI